jgi:16S rRNA (uracil1498-N3)-methyltransferase
MTPSRFFVASSLTSGTQFTLENEPAHHALKVLRVKRGDTLILFNGNGGEYEARVVECKKKSVALDVLRFNEIERESPLKIMLAQAISAADRMDLTIRQAVELGVAEMQPLITQRSLTRLASNHTEKKIEHWQRVAIAACEQCGRNRIPRINAPKWLESWLAESHDGNVVRLLLSPRGKKSLRHLASPPGEIVLLTGPEAGFSEHEEAGAQAAGYVAIEMGPRILRTETAAAAALAAMQTLWGDFKSGDD